MLIGEREHNFDSIETHAGPGIRRGNTLKTENVPIEFNRRFDCGYGQHGSDSQEFHCASFGNRLRLTVGFQRPIKIHVSFTALLFPSGCGLAVQFIFGGTFRS